MWLVDSPVIYISCALFAQGDNSSWKLRTSMWRLIKTFTKGQDVLCSHPQKDLGRGEWQKWRGCMVLKLKKSRQWRLPCSLSLIEAVTKSSPNTGLLFPLSCEYLVCAVTWHRSVWMAASVRLCCWKKQVQILGLAGLWGRDQQGQHLSCLSVMVTVHSTYIQLSSSE